MLPAFPKPSQIKKKPEAVIKYGDREVCNFDCKAGRDEYERRKTVMWERQFGLCCLCGGRLLRSEAVFEHQDGRGHGGGNRDDRTEIDGKPYNGVAHVICNSQKGSKRGGYVI